MRIQEIFKRTHGYPFKGYPLKTEKRRKGQWFRQPLGQYLTFVICASVFCIALSQFSPNSRLRGWYYELTNKPIINKGLENVENGKDIRQESGSFLTYYRFQEFGESDPAWFDATAPMIAITFDDGPNPEYTKQILNILNENYSHATFFVVGTNAESYPDTLKSILAAGSEIGNHSYSHVKLTSLTPDEVEEEIGRVNRAVKKATGESTTVIRPPYGAYDDALLQQLPEPVVLWDLDTEDWNSRNAQTIVDSTLAAINDGDIILMHDIYESTVEAVELLIPKLKEQGYQIVTVSELAEYKGKALELGKAYGKFKQE